MMRIKTIVTGELEENCYLVFDEATETLYVIDPGDEAERLIAAAKEFPFRSCHILLTHGHIDHISALNEVFRTLPAEDVLVSAAEMPLLQSPANRIMPYLPALTELPPFIHEPPPDAPYEKLPTPGHTRGGVCYWFKSIPAMFVGDTIFASSVGRTDLPGGDWEELLSSIRREIFTKDDGLKLYPGHGPFTAVGTEKRCNPYLQ